MTLPTFLLLGAAKSGTTSLCSYLAQHPHVFICTPKEPNFFALEGQQVCFAGPGDSIINHASVTQLADYESLFQGAPEQSERGEASTMYLYDARAPGSIHRYTPDIKLLALLRNPADRAYSSYLHMVRDGREPLPTFEEALRAEEARIAANWEHLWHYKHLGFYSRQLQRYFGTFAAEQIAIYTYEQLQHDPLEVVRQIFQFLNVSTDFRPDTSARHEVSGAPRSRLLNMFMKRPSRLKSLGKRVVSPSTRGRVYSAVMKYNIVARYPPLNPETRQALLAAYREDIKCLEVMINRDLSDWLRQ
jgi:Sulfotransferase family